MTRCTVISSPMRRVSLVGAATEHRASVSTFGSDGRIMREMQGSVGMRD
jgi:hypothetical protein